MDTSTLLRFLAVVATAGGDRVTFCGGDPLSRPDIISLLRGTRDLGFRANLDTVGTALLGGVRTLFYGRVEVAQLDIGELAPVVDRLGIPLDGDSNEVVLAFRAGRPRLFEEQLQLLAMLDKAGVDVCINTVVHKLNIHHLEGILDAIYRSSCVCVWQLFQYSPTGPHGYRNREKFFVEDEEFAQAAAVVQQGLVEREARLRLDCKFNRDRGGRYLLVDSDGLAWVPRYGYARPGAERVILGDITNPEDDRQLLAVLAGGELAETTPGCKEK